jgi:hypothetical protein
MAPRAMGASERIEAARRFESPWRTRSLSGSLVGRRLVAGMDPATLSHADPPRRATAGATAAARAALDGNRALPFPSTGAHEGASPESAAETGDPRS